MKTKLISSLPSFYLTALSGLCIVFVFVFLPSFASCDEVQVLVNVNLEHPDAAWAQPKIYLYSGKTFCSSSFANSECRTDTLSGGTGGNPGISTTFSVQAKDSIKITMDPRANWPNTQYGAAVPATFRIKMINKDTGKAQKSSGQITTTSRGSVTLDIFPLR